MTIIGLFDGFAIVKMTGLCRRCRRRFHVELYLNNVDSAPSARARSCSSLSCLFELEFTLCYLCALPRTLGRHMLPRSFQMKLRHSLCFPSLCVCLSLYSISFRKMQHFSRAFRRHLVIGIWDRYLECRPRSQVRLGNFDENNMKSSEATHEGRICRSPTVRYLPP